MNKTSIEWTHRPETRGSAGGMTWNPIRARLKYGDCDCPCESCNPIGQGHCGVKPCDQPRKLKTGTFCTRISPGCTNCYASAINKRFGNGLEYTVPNLEKVEFVLSEKILQEPLKTMKPCTIFVGDMFDLFHEAIGDAEISYVFATMKDAPRHTFQLLTKRADRMRQFVERWGGVEPNVWLGVSVESQKYADERIPLLLQTPAAVRFLSVEPMLESICLWQVPPGHHRLSSLRDPSNVGVDWVICGGESGPRSRLFNLVWAERLLEQCRGANTPFFMKQLGSKPHVHSCRNEYCTHPDCGNEPIKLRDRKGGDPLEWPEHLRVREFPA